jgi:hypothetical protein
VLSFGDPAATDAPKVAISDIELPLNTDLEMVLQTPIKPPNSAVGDPVTAILTKAAKKDGNVLIPKGALVHGRITLLRKQNASRPLQVIGLQFTELEAGNLRAQLSVDLTDVYGIGDLITLPGRRKDSASWLMTDLNATTFGSVLFVKGNNWQLPRGLRMSWRTVARKTEDKQ